MSFFFNYSGGADEDSDEQDNRQYGQRQGYGGGYGQQYEDPLASSRRARATRETYEAAAMNERARRAELARRERVRAAALRAEREQAQREAYEDLQYQAAIEARRIQEAQARQARESQARQERQARKERKERQAQAQAQAMQAQATLARQAREERQARKERAQRMKEYERQREQERLEEAYLQQQQQQQQQSNNSMGYMQSIFNNLNFGTSVNDDEKEQMQSKRKTKKKAASKTMSNPLVLMIPIVYYNINKDLMGVKQDYKNMIKLWQGRYGYSLHFRENKFRWNKKDIIEYYNEGRELLIKNKHDGLIFIISCHGSNDNKILCSNEELFNLNCLYKYFTGESHVKMAGLPKLFFLDCCRGNNRQQTMFATTKGLSTSQQMAHSDENMCKIYGNTEGNTTTDTQTGGAFLNTVVDVFSDVKDVAKRPIQILIVDMATQIEDFAETQMVDQHASMKVLLYLKRNQ